MIVHSFMFLPSRDLLREEERMKTWTFHSLISLRYKGALSLSFSMQNLVLFPVQYVHTLSIPHYKRNGFKCSIVSSIHS